MSLLSTTALGIAYFNNTKILSSGSFIIKASLLNAANSGISSGSTKAINIINNIQQITVSSITSISTYFNFIISLSLYGDDGNYFIEQTTINISSEDGSLLGNIAGNTSTGKLIMTVYFIKDSSKNISIASQSPNYFNYT